MALPEEFRYLEQAFELTGPAPLEVLGRRRTDPAEAYLRLMRSVLDQIEARQDYGAIAAWLSSGGLTPEREALRVLLDIMVDLMQNGMLPGSAQVERLAQEGLAMMPFLEMCDLAVGLP